MTTIKPVKHTVTFERLGNISNYQDPTGYYNLPVNGSGDTYDALASGDVNGVSGYLNSFNGTTATATMPGVISEKYFNCYGRFAIDGVKQPGLYNMTYQSSRSGQGGFFNFDLLSHSVWDGKGMRAVDSPYGDIPYANTPNKYNYNYKYSTGSGTNGGFKVKVIYYLYGFNGNGKNGGYYEERLTSSDGALDDDKIKEIAYLAYKKAYDFYSGYMPGNYAISGIYGIVDIKDLVEKLNADHVYGDFKKRQSGDVVPADDTYSVTFNNGDQGTLSGSDLVTHSGASIEELMNSFYVPTDSSISTASLSQVVMNGANNFLNIKPFTIGFSVPSGLISFAKNIADLTRVSGQPVPTDFKLPDEALKYADVEEMMAISTATSYGEYYHEAVKTINADEDLAQSFGGLFSIFNFITFVLDKWENSSIAQLLRVYKTIAATAQNTTGKIEDTSQMMMAPLIAAMKEEFLKDRSGKSSISDITIDDVPEWSTGNIGSGSFGYLDFQNVWQVAETSEAYGHDVESKYGVSMTQQQDAGSFLVNNGLSVKDLKPGCTVHIEPGHAWNVTGNGKEPITSLIIY